MADHNEVAYTTADGNDYPAHEQTYEGFIMLVKYGTAAVIFIVAMMAIFLTCLLAGRVAAGRRGLEKLHAFRPQNRYPFLRNRR
jgi:hypothetical protein